MNQFVFELIPRTFFLRNLAHKIQVMKSIVLFVCLTSGLFSMETVSAQSATTISVQPFPEQCIGTWKGMMHIYAYGNLRDSVQVELNVVKIDDNSWKWRTDYLSEKMPVTKDYLMRLDPKSANTFLLDEGDGIVLTNYLTGSKLYSNFETEGILLGSSYEFIGGNLVFEVTSGKKLNEAEESGVTNFSVDFVQRVVLKKMR